jgi:hypothetical protein
MALGLVWEGALSERCQVLLLVSGVVQKLNGEHAAVYDQTSSEMSQQNTDLEAQISFYPIKFQSNNLRFMLYSVLYLRMLKWLMMY